VGHVDRARFHIDDRDFGEHHCEIFLLRHKLTNGRSDLGGGEKRGRYLVKKRLKDVMIAPINQKDFCIASSQRPRRGDPGKAAANDDDALFFVGVACGCEKFCLDEPNSL
jgi:hypothetical protein